MTKGARTTGNQLTTDAKADEGDGGENGKDDLTDDGKGSEKRLDRDKRYERSG